MRSIVFVAAGLCCAGCAQKEPTPAAVGRGPQVGDVVEIVGKDLDGNPLKLSDYRGKVVLLDFWATWCAPCRALFPNNRSLIHRYKDRPFVLLGVNTDGRAALAKQLEEKGDVTWKSFWDGPRGPIVARWQIPGYPTLAVIDAKGVLRYHEVTPWEVDARIEELVREAETPGS